MEADERWQLKVTRGHTNYERKARRLFVLRSFGRSIERRRDRHWVWTNRIKEDGKKQRSFLPAPMVMREGGKGTGLPGAMRAAAATKSTPSEVFDR